MSRKVATLVYGKQVGSMARKAVLAYLADRASDDGTGVWTAKQRIADEIECSKQTVITVMRSLADDGLIVEVGQVSNRNGYTIEYALVLTEIEKLPNALTRETEKRVPRGQKVDRSKDGTGPKLDRSTSLTPRGQTALPKPSCNQSPEEAEASSRPAGAETTAAAPSKRKSEGAPGKAASWTPPAITDLPPRIRAIAEQWEVGAYDAFGEGHGAYLASAGRRRDLDRSWHARIVDLGDKPNRAAKGGIRYAAPPPGDMAAPAIAVASCGTIGEDEASRELRASLEATCSAGVYRRWLEPCRYEFVDDAVIVVAPTPFVQSWVKNNFEHRLQAEATRILGLRAAVEWRIERAVGQAA